MFQQILNKIKKFKLPHFDFDEVQLMYALTGLVFLVAVVLGMWFGWSWWKGKHQQPNLPVEIVEEIKQPEEVKCEYQRILDGVCVFSTEEINPKILAVMIENHPDARPQAGLAKASVVYEALVEGNFTRFLAIFPAGVEVNKAGPVRSARPYYLDWVSEYGDAVYLHCGGSPVALDLIATDRINDLNEFFRGWYFWRANNRYAPHNVYTSSELWNKAIEDYPNNYTKTDFVGWTFGQIDNCSVDCHENIKINYGSFSFTAEWKYNSSTEKYARWQSGWPQADDDGTPVLVDTVIVQTVPARVLDNVGRVGMDTIGQGEDKIFVKGKMIVGKWKKDSRVDRTKWVDENGDEIVLAPGKIWVEVVSERTEVEVNESL
jgi:hypothetical protein